MTDLKPCPWCNSTEHLLVRSVGVLTADMPARPYRVICTNIGHDPITGPVAYGEYDAGAAWNQRPADPHCDALADLLDCAVDEFEGWNGRVINPASQHWSVSARAALAAYRSAKP